MNSLFSLIANFLLVSLFVDAGTVVPLIELPLNSGWKRVEFNGTAIGNTVPGVFVIRNPCPAVFTFSDAFCPGEMVDISLNGTFALTSSSVPSPSACIPSIPNPDGTFAFPNLFSHAKVDLSPGETIVTLNLKQFNPEVPTGAFFIRADVPLKTFCPLKLPLQNQ